MLALLTIIAGLLGCGTEPQQAQDLGGQEELIGLFVNEAALRGVAVDTSHLVVTYDSLADNTLGVCSMTYSGPKVILNIKSWGSLTPSQKELLVFHELGHCLFDYRHFNGSKANIMRSYALPDWYYKVNRTELLDDFFTNHME